jgi:peptidoglycan LD-endopeptidase CwlK
MSKHYKIQFISHPGLTLIAVALAAYFVVAVTISALFLLPPARTALMSVATQLHRRMVRHASHGMSNLRTSIDKSVTISHSRLNDTKKILIRRRLLILITAGILAAPPLIAIALRGRQLFQFDGVTRVPDEKIAALLNGEQLVPPPPLPPEIFATREVEQVRPALRDASRDWNLLDADFRKRLLLVYKIMREQYGYEMALLEGYRSPERQDRLAQLGGVTNAAGYQSYHQYGLAADNAFLRDGKIVISEKDPWAMRGYQLYGQTAEQVGLVWGGRWKLMDFGHVEYHKPGFVLGRRPVGPAVGQ